MIPLKATARDSKLKPRQMRRGSQVPCVVYGSVDSNIHVQCEAQELHKAYVKAGESTLIELEVAGKKVPVLIKAITFDPITDREQHVDFYAVNMKQEIEAPVPLHFEGESPAVKAEGGVLVTPHDTVRVRCLPADLPHSLTVNISKLESFHDSVYVKDLQLPKGVSIVEPPETLLVTVQEPRKEEEIAPPVVAAAEGAVPAEGAAAAPGAPAAAGAAPAAAEGEKDKGKEKK